MRLSRLGLVFVFALTACRAADPLTFSDITIDELAGTRALLRFTTNRAVRLEIQLGSTADVLDKTFTDPELTPGQLTTEHRVPLENLFPNTKYFFQAKTKDENDTVVYSPAQEFRTPVEAVSRLTNVALTEAGTTVVSVSSALDPDTTGGARALDGDFVTDWATKGDGDAARIELDLGQMRTLTAFGFRSRGLSDGTAVVSKVGLSLDGAAELTFDTPDPRRLYVFTLSAPVAARRAVVRAITSTGGNTGAKEIQLLVP